jgi:hypothetical protein
MRWWWWIIPLCWVACRPPAVRPSITTPAGGPITILVNGRTLTGEIWIPSVSATTIRLTVVIPRHADNRSWTLQLFDDADILMLSQQRSMEGEASPVVWPPLEVLLAPGVYRLEATVSSALGVRGRVTGRLRVGSDLDMKVLPRTAWLLEQHHKALSEVRLHGGLEPLLGRRARKVLGAHVQGFVREVARSDAMRAVGGTGDDQRLGQARIPGFR